MTKDSSHPRKTSEAKPREATKTEKKIKTNQGKMTNENAAPDCPIEMRNPKSLKRHPDQDWMFRDTSDAESRALKLSLYKDGLQQPIHIRPDGTILSGHRRVQAAIDLGWDTIECIVRIDLEKKGPKACEAFLISDNLQRRHLDKLAQARAVKRLVELEWRCGTPSNRDIRDAIAARLGMCKRNASRYRAVLDLPRALQDAVSDGRLKLELAAKGANLSEAVTNDICKRMQAGENPNELFRQRLRPAKEPDKGAYLSHYVRATKDLLTGISNLDGLGSLANWQGDIPVLSEGLEMLKRLIGRISADARAQQRLLKKLGVGEAAT